MPRLAEVELETGTRNVESEQTEEVSAKKGEEGCEEELAARDEGEGRVSQVRDVDVLEPGDEEQRAEAGVSAGKGKRLAALTFPRRDRSSYCARRVRRGGGGRHMS